MSELRRAVSDAISKEWMRHVVSKSGRTPRSDQLADAAIRAFVTALLQPEVVEAAAKLLYQCDGNDAEWDGERPTYQNKYRGRAEDTLAAALAAMAARDTD